jgi:cytochrome c556
MRPTLTSLAAVAWLAAAPVLAADAGKLAPEVAQAIETRQAVYTVINYNFKPLVAILKGAAPYDAADTPKRIARLVMLADHLDDMFPDISNAGDPATKAKPDIWANRADVNKRIKDLQTHLAALQQVAGADKAASDGFKAALTTVAQDCKGCHDNYRAK